MRIRRRRRIDIGVLAGVVVLAGLAAVAGLVAAEPERVPQLWAGAAVGGDGGALITEVIDYDFAARQRHGIYRDIPGLDPADPVRVDSGTAPDQVQVTGTAHQTRLRIGDPDRTVTGRHRYAIRYRLPGVAPEGRLAWDAVGTSWTVAIGQAEVHVVAPWRLKEVACVRGVTGATDPCPVAQPEPGHLVATLEDLDPGQGVTLYATAGGRLATAPALPAPPAGAPADPGTGPLPPAVAAALATLAAAVAGTWLVRRAGREWVAAGGAAEAAFDPGAGPVRRVDPADKVAWLIGAAVDGYLDLEGEGRRVTLVRRPRRDGAPAYLLDMAFGGRDRLTLGSYDVSFASAWRLVGTDLDGWRRTSALWDPAGDRRRARVLGVVAGVAGLVLIGVGAVLAACGALAGPGWPALVAAGGLLAGAGAATCASTPPGRWPWASWTAGRGRWRPRRWRPPIPPRPATRCSARPCSTTPRGRRPSRPPVGRAGAGPAAEWAAVPVAAGAGPGDVDCGFARDID